MPIPGTSSLQLRKSYIYLTTGIPPVISFTFPYFVRLIPFLIVNRIVFFLVARGIRTWRSEQHNVALFPLWIRALTSAVNNVAFGRKLGFVVTPKDGTVHRRSLADLQTVWPQIAFITATVAAILWGLALVARGDDRWVGILVNCFWAGYNIALLSAAPYAALWQPPGAVAADRLIAQTVRTLRGTPGTR